MIPSPVGAAVSYSPAQGAASCLGWAGERGRAGACCPRREDGGGGRGAVIAAGCAVSVGGARRRRDGKRLRVSARARRRERHGLRAPRAGEGGSGFWEVGFGNLFHRLPLAMTPGGRRRQKGGIGSVNEWAAAAAAPLLNGCWADTRQPRSRCLPRPPVFCLRLASLGAPQTCSTSSSSSSSCCSSSTSSSSSSSTIITLRRSREAGKRRYARPGIRGLSRGTALLRLPALRPSSPRRGWCGAALPWWGRRQREAGEGWGARASIGAEPGGTEGPGGVGVRAAAPLGSCCVPSALRGTPSAVQGCSPREPVGDPGSPWRSGGWMDAPSRASPLRAGRTAGAQGKRLLQKHSRATLSRHEHFIVSLLNLNCLFICFLCLGLLVWVR